MNCNSLFLSIVIPVYNAEKYLQECLDSCLNQDFPSEQYEIICVNDGSTDSSLEILLNYEKKYNNVVVVNQSNKGVSTARNIGIETAKGEYIWFIDADDYIPDGFLKELYEKYYCKDYDMVLFGAYAFTESLSADELEQHKNGNLRPNQAIQNDCITRRLIQKDYIESHKLRFHKKIAYGEDSLFNYMLFVYKPKVAIFDKLGYFYRIHSGSAMRNKSYESKIKYIDSHITVIEVIKSFYDKEEKKRFRSIKYILDDVQYILDVIAGIPFDNAKEEIRKLQNIDVLPFKKHEGFNKKDIAITLYTNFMCCIYSILIRTSTNKIGFALLKYESKLMKGSLMKKLLKIIKKNYSYMSKD